MQACSSLDPQIHCTDLPKISEVNPTLEVPVSCHCSPCELSRILDTKHIPQLKIIYHDQVHLRHIISLSKCRQAGLYAKSVGRSVFPVDPHSSICLEFTSPAAWLVTSDAISYCRNILVSYSDKHLLPFLSCLPKIFLF